MISKKIKKDFSSPRLDVKESLDNPTGTIEMPGQSKLTKRLIFGKKRISGRNNNGRITVRRRGGGHKRNYRIVSVLTKQKNGEGTSIGNTGRYQVLDLVYDPNRTAPLALIGPVQDIEQGINTEKTESDLYQGREQSKKNFNRSCLKFIIAPKGIKIGDQVTYWENEKTIRPVLGDSLPLEKMPLGSIVHGIQLFPENESKYIRAAGGYGQIIDHLIKTDVNGIVDGKHKKVLIRLPSGEKKWFPANGRGSIGSVGFRYSFAYGGVRRANPDVQPIEGINHVENPEEALEQSKSIRKKAGRSRWLGRRPKVRGVAMNPVDHPHGGRTSGGRPSVTPWGRPTKGWKTRSAAKNKKRAKIVAQKFLL